MLSSLRGYISDINCQLSGVGGWGGLICDFQAGMGAAVNDVVQSGTWTGTIVTGYSLTTGAMLWNKTVMGVTEYSSMVNVADHGLIAVLMQAGVLHDLGSYLGKLVWTSQKMDYPWDAGGFGAYAIQSGYGLLYGEAYSGVYAFNWTNGQIVWKYEAPAPAFETPYTGANGTSVYSFMDLSMSGD